MSYQENSCEFCGLIFGNYGVAQEHVDSCDGVIDPSGHVLQCTNCDALFGEPEIADQHSVHCVGRGEEERERELLNRWEPAIYVDYAILDVMEARYNEFKGMTPKRRRSHWEEVGKLLGLDPERVKTKWNSLYNSFKRRQENASQKKTGRGGIKPWCHEEQMIRILGDNPAVRPHHLITSMPAPLESAAGEVDGSNEAQNDADSPLEPLRRDPVAGTPKGAPAAATSSASKATPTTSRSKTSTRRRSASAVEELVRKAEARDEWVKDYFQKKEQREEKRIKLEEERLTLLREIANKLTNARE